MSVGRPSSYSQEIADAICERIADGDSLRSICDDEGFPNKATVFRWLAANTAFRDQYALSRESQADALFDDILSIADDGRNDWMERRGEEDAGWVANGEHMQRSKLRVDARKWMAGKLKPKVYGEKTTNELTGPNGAPLVEKPNTTDLAKAMLAVLTRGGE